ncbi:hypothetical protein KSP40_PGU005510 [Platanthera guangdongensis]|uniref:Uncharacterized protein n=1 Tax=Platanthera guangdongensis TaxID=2320717 RepID=A0ABR2LQK2_9ASPA
MIYGSGCWCHSEKVLEQDIDKFIADLEAVHPSRNSLSLLLCRTSSLGEEQVASVC